LLAFIVATTPIFFFFLSFHFGPSFLLVFKKRLGYGRIFAGEQAKTSGLVDEIGYLDDAVEVAKKKAGLTEARVVSYRRPGEFQNNIYSRMVAPSPSLANLANIDLLSMVRGGSPQFMYLWMP
jgi:protease-4